MPLDNLDYKNMTDYLARLYQRQPFVRHGIAHPVTVFYPSESQIHDVDSLLDPWLPTPEERDFAVYDYSYLHDLQNSKPGLYNGSTFTLKRIRQNPLKLRGQIGGYYDMLATCAALERELCVMPPRRACCALPHAPHIIGMSPHKTRSFMATNAARPSASAR